LKPGTTYDIWGIAREPGSKESHHMTRMNHPMQAFDALEQIQDYPWPDFKCAPIDHVHQDVVDIHALGCAAVFAMGCTIWETSWYIRGMPELMMDMATGDEKAVWLLDKITETACYRASVAAKAGVDIINLGDDVGMQNRIMMSVSMYREWLKPRLAKVISTAKAIKPDVLIYYHSCGYIIPFIDDFIEVGVEILNPVQPECMDFASIHEKYSDSLSFNGTLGTQTTMPFGSVTDVEEVVLKNLEISGPQGGLVVTPTHMVEPEVPWENIEAYVRACKAYSGL
jgi:uroporphyrinogen decarboxylase